MEKTTNQVALSADILRIIFLLLPRQSIIRFQLVCKYWYKIISDPLFIRNYRSKPTSFFGFFYTSSLSPSIHFLPFSETATLFNTLSSIGIIIRHDHLVTFLDSCNGLVFHFFKVSGPNAGTSSYIVCNPITCQISRLPPPPTLAAEPKPFLVHGFVSSTGNITTSPYFEVIRVLRSGRTGLVVSTFSSKIQRWTWKSHVSNFLEEWYMELTGVGTLCNGSLHWLCLPLGLVAYDLRTEQFSVIKVPEDHGRLSGESEGCLLYIRIKRDYKCCVWILEDYIRTKWCLKYSIDFNKLPMHMNSPYKFNDLYTCVLAFDPVDAAAVFLRVGKKIILYHLQSCETKEVGEVISEETRLATVCPFKMPKSPINWVSSASYSKILSTPKRGWDLTADLWNLGV